MELTEFYGANLTDAKFVDTKLNKPFAIIVNEVNLSNLHLNDLTFDYIDVVDSKAIEKLSQ